jgi:excisionase family DNA binding protein
MALLGYFGQAGHCRDWCHADETGVVGEPKGKTMTAHTPESEPLLTPAEVATMFRVDPKTVTRWAKSGKLTSIRTLGGHRRYRETEVRRLLSGIPTQRSDD